MAKLAAYLSYRDPQAAIAWLEALGFQTTTRNADDEGKIVHAELKLGEAAVMLAAFDADYEIAPLRGRSTGSGLYMVIEDVQDIFDRAVAAGASPVFEPEQTEWGTWRARVLDPEGHEWSFGSYEPGQSW